MDSDELARDMQNLTVGWHSCPLVTAASDRNLQPAYDDSMSDRYYVDGRLQPGPFVIEGGEAHHLAHVCRLDVADSLTLFNGDGHDYPARVTAIELRRVIVEVADAVKANRELGFPLIIAAAMSKGDRTQFLIGKLTELGVSTFVPLLLHRSVVKPHENKLEKLQRYVIEASKQCGRNVLMTIEPPARWDDYCRRGDLPARRFLAHPGGTGDRAEIAVAASLVFAIGPEGGFTVDEIHRGVEAGWQLLDLGPRILRIETAATALAAWTALRTTTLPTTLPTK